MSFEPHAIRYKGRINGKVFEDKGIRFYYRKVYGKLAWHEESGTPIGYDDAVIAYIESIGVTDIMLLVEGAGLLRTTLDTLLANADLQDTNQGLKRFLPLHFYTTAGVVQVPFLPDITERRERD